MTDVYFDPVSHGFFQSDIHASESIPETAIKLKNGEIEHAELCAGLSRGLIIVIDNDYPVLQEAPPLTDDQIIEIAKMHQYAAMLDASTKMTPLQDAIDLDIATDDEIARLNDWKRYRVELNRISQQPGYPRDIQWPIAPSDS